MPHFKKELNDESEVADCLRQLIAAMDAAIAQAIENPLLFLDGPFLNAIESRCASLAAIEEQTPMPQPIPGPAQISQSGELLRPARHSRTEQAGLSNSTLSALVWEVRGRAGRLQRLLDSASQFYSTCFSSRKAECLDYGVHGEWGQVANPSHLAIDC